MIISTWSSPETSPALSKSSEVLRSFGLQAWDPNNLDLTQGSQSNKIISSIAGIPDLPKFQYIQFKVYNTDVQLKRLQGLPFLVQLKSNPKIIQCADNREMYLVETCNSTVHAVWKDQVDKYYPHLAADTKINFINRMKWKMNLHSFQTFVLTEQTNDDGLYVMYLKPYPDGKGFIATLAKPCNRIDFSKMLLTSLAYEIQNSKAISKKELFSNFEFAASYLCKFLSTGCMPFASKEYGLNLNQYSLPYRLTTPADVIHRVSIHNSIPIRTKQIRDYIHRFKLFCDGEWNFRITDFSLLIPFLTNPELQNWGSTVFYNQLCSVRNIWNAVNPKVTNPFL